MTDFDKPADVLDGHVLLMEDVGVAGDECDSKFFQQRDPIFDEFIFDGPEPVRFDFFERRQTRFLRSEENVDEQIPVAEGFAACEVNFDVFAVTILQGFQLLHQLIIRFGSAHRVCFGPALT